MTDTTHDTTRPDVEAALGLIEETASMTCTGCKDDCDEPKVYLTEQSPALDGAFATLRAYITTLESRLAAQDEVVEAALEAALDVADFFWKDWNVDADDAPMCLLRFRDAYRALFRLDQREGEQS